MFPRTKTNPAPELTRLVLVAVAVSMSLSRAHAPCNSQQPQSPRTTHASRCVAESLNGVTSVECQCARALGYMWNNHPRTAQVYTSASTRDCIVLRGATVCRVRTRVERSCCCDPAALVVGSGPSDESETQAGGGGLTLVCVVHRSLPFSRDRIGRRVGAPRWALIRDHERETGDGSEPDSREEG